MAAERIRVESPDGAYDILIGAGLLARAEEWCPRGRTLIVTNTTLAPIYGHALAAALPGAALAVVPDGEAFKTLETVARLYAECVAAGMDRAGTIIALGGGVVGDTAGFAAATYLRGVRLVQIPTSLLAMVDSSVGGKVGVDLPQGKNLVGAFKQPEAVVVDPSTLATLPEREWRCGMAEVIKHGLLADEGLLDLIERRSSDRRAPLREAWPGERAAELVRRAVQVKVDVVQRDPFEQNVRAYLNLGHTFGHAVEQVTAYAWPHGEAVGAGLVAAARLSLALGLCDAALPERVERIVGGVGLPTRLGGLDPEAVYAAMGTDKKRQAGRLRFVVLRGAGQPALADDVPEKVVKEVIGSLR